MPPFIARQGDVLVVPSAASIAAPEVAPTSGRHILAEGNATGHHHSIAAESVRFFRPNDIGVGMGGALVVTEPVMLEHQEHAAITIPAGTYDVVRQREYSPAAIRAVED